MLYLIIILLSLLVLAMFIIAHLWDRLHFCQQHAAELKAEAARWRRLHDECAKRLFRRFSRH